MIKSVLIKISNKFLRRKIYSTYNDALADCLNTGYEDEELARTVYYKTKLFKEGLLPGVNQGKYSKQRTNLLISLLKSLGSEAWVLDFGGACGAGYFTFKKKLGQGYRLNWVVVETEKMCSYGRKLENKELKFFPDINLARLYMPSIDVINLEGSLQYTQEPYELISTVLESRARFILFSRMCFTSEDRNIIAIQKTMLNWHSNRKLPPGIKNKEMRFPFTVIQKRKFDALVQKEYEYSKVFADNSGIIRINDEPIFGLGLLCRRKAA